MHISLSGKAAYGLGHGNSGLALARGCEQCVEPMFLLMFEVLVLPAPLLFSRDCNVTSRGENLVALTTEYSQLIKQSSLYSHKLRGSDSLATKVILWVVFRRLNAELSALLPR